jgi:hypothetical protein
MLEGLTNLGVAGRVLLWPAIATVAFLHVLSRWAIVTGGRCLLPRAGTTRRMAVGCLPSPAPSLQVGAFCWRRSDLMPRMNQLVTYAVLFGVTLLALGVRLRRRHHRPGNLTALGWRDGRVTSGATPP